MTYAEIAKERDDLKSEIETLRAIMDKMLEKGKALEKENDELKARLKKAVELPCKAGDTVFAIIGHRECVEVFKVMSIEIFKSIIYVRLAGFFKMSLPLTEYGKRFFTDLEAAEARLKELRGGKE